MATSVTTWVWNNSRSKHGARLVLLAIADAIHEDRVKAGAWPSVAALAEKTALKERAVRAAITELAGLGELAVEYNAGPKGCNRYHVVTTPAKNAGVQKMQGAESAPRQSLQGQESSQADDQTPAKSAPPAESAPLQKTTVTPAKSAPGNSKNHKNSPTESSRGGVGEQDSALFDEETPKPKRTRGRPPKANLGPEFDEWYAAYPVHKARGDAEKAWVQVIREGADPVVLIAAAKRYREDPQVSRGYGKFPAGWLRAKCWLDEPADSPPPNASANGGKRTNYTDEEYASGW